ncbi:MAG: (d)CMP kinase [Candidatus Omnitrophota bacterium]
MMLFRDMNVVAIDGPAGSGKSTVSKLVAEKLGYLYIDTGAMYRALTLKVMRKNIDFGNENEIIKLSTELDFKLKPSSDGSGPVKVFLDGEDISEEIRKLEVTGNVKYIARIPEVRGNLVELQRRMAAEMNGTVMEGRDIGTVVLPDAKYKFYVDASFDERVERRLAELRAKGHPVSRKDVEEDLKQRDHADKTRKVGPLKKAEDAVFLDTTDLSIEDVVAAIISRVQKKK